MKSKSIILLAAMSLGALPMLASAAAIAPKASISATSTATTTPAEKAGDPLLVLVAKFSDSITQVNAKISSLGNTDTDVAPAQKYLENARSGLNAVKISLSSIVSLDAMTSTSTATGTAAFMPAATSTAMTASSTSEELPKTRDEIRKDAKNDLIGVYNNLLAAITALKKSIVVERVRLDSPDDSGSSETIAPAASATVINQAPAATGTPATSLAN